MRAKNRKKIILITCAGGSGPIYLSRTLRRRFIVILADGSRDNAGPFIGLPFYLTPFGNDPSYGNVLKQIVKKHYVDYVVPGADEELVPLNDLMKEIKSFVLIAPDKDFITLCLNKKQLMIELDKIHLSHLPPFARKQDVTYPAIAKPIYGRGSRQVHQVKNIHELNGYLDLYGKKFSDVLVQKYIPGVEYTVSVIVNNVNAIIGIVPKRIISKKGITRSAVAERNVLIEKVCRDIVASLKPGGPFNVQLMLYRGKVYIFEINPRLSTTSVLTDKAFGNEIELFIKYYGKTVIIGAPAMKASVRLYRYEENIFK